MPRRDAPHFYPRYLVHACDVTREDIVLTSGTWRSVRHIETLDQYRVRLTLWRPDDLVTNRLVTITRWKLDLVEIQMAVSDGD